MFRKEKPLTLKSSASSLSNNLSVLVAADKNSLSYAVVHKAVVNIISASTDGSTVTNRQVLCKEPSTSQQSTPMIIQAKFIQIPVRTVLVLTSLRGVQMFESDGSSMIYWHALVDVNSTDFAENDNFGRGISGLGETFICVGSQQGDIHVFNIPAKGTNITLKESLIGHKHPICDLASDNDERLVSSDEMGDIIVWTLSGTSIKQTHAISGSGWPCSSLVFWKNIVVGGYGNGEIKLYCAKTGKQGAVVCAHGRWVNGLDVARDNGRLLSASEDSYLRVWQLKEGPLPEIEYKYSESVTDQQLVGVQFLHQGGKAFCVTGYDSSDVNFYVQS